METKRKAYQTVRLFLCLKTEENKNTMDESKTKATTEKTAKEGAKQRTEKELQELIEKREKIRAMLKEKRTKFSAAEIELLYRQDAAMTMYADTLAERLKIWREV